ncbi:hypothetical protein MA16_Dca003503 [Dendrobium catenatum]|uniref:DUF7075 domain-containing protein n=1 Tax=Dendrobium catenatum TaxID=906689 RepID=A0A2I0WF66_9ASPA|nr:hypothetical protein MA16_Dca003503 [Dendrobium catenatum]
MKEVSARGTSPEFPSSGHQVVKIIGNLCFFIFVSSVIVFSVIAATYQPPYPWFQTSKAITKSLSATLPNSTFAIDDSLLHTGEDLVASPPSAVGRYLYYTRGGDYYKSMNHCMELPLWPREAKFLNRTFIMDLIVCLAGSYTCTGENEDGKDFRFYFNFEHLKNSASVVEGDFLWDRRKCDHSFGKRLLLP